MGRIHGYRFTHVLLVGLNDEVPPFDDDTLVTVCADDDPYRGKLISFQDWFESFDFKEWETE